MHDHQNGVPRDWRRHESKTFAIYAPPDWHRKQSGLHEVVLMAPQEPGRYRPVVTLTQRPLTEQVGLSAVVEMAARAEHQSLTDMNEYERRHTTLAGLPAIQRELGWVED